MWTHKHCFSKTIPTSDNIKDNAQFKIAQSLKFGRTIAVTGAGVSAAYGYLSWNELAQFIALDTLDMVDAFLPPDQPDKYEEIRFIAQEIATILDPDLLQQNKKIQFPLHFNLPAIDTKVSPGLIQLCRDVRKLINVEKGDNCLRDNFVNLELDNSVRKIFDGQFVNSFKARLRCIDKRIYMALLKAIDEQNKQEPQNIKLPKNIYPSYLSLEIDCLEKIQNAAKPTNVGLLKTIYKSLLAFDKENYRTDGPYGILIEKLQLSRFVTTNYDEEIEKTFTANGFLQKPSSEQANEHTKVFTNGYGEVLLSRAPVDDSVGDLLVFASTATESSASIFHLHGAVSVATNKRLVISEEDYQEQYLKGLDRRIVFDEGLRTLFGGNDILFLGSGMSEEDLLRPLRQYLAERPKFPRQRRTLVAVKDYKDVGQLKSETLSMNYKYNVDIIGYLKATTPRAKNKSTDPAIRCAGMIQRAQINQKNAARLEQEILNLYNKSQDWWKAWQRLPESRMASWLSEKRDDTPLVARYKFSNLMAPDNEYTKQYFAAINKLCGEEIQTSLDEQGRKGANSRILRFSSPGGTGKGFFCQLLRTAPMHGNLFTRAKDEKYIASFFADAYFSTEFNSTIAAFGRFLFDTVKDLFEKPGRRIRLNQHEINIDALQKYLSEIQPFHRPSFARVFNTASKKSSGILNIITQLFYLVRLLSDEHERIFICLSDLDRLCDTNGYAYSPLHRSAFRLLSGILPGNNKESKAPMGIRYDLIVIADEPHAPIRYLSEYHDPGNPNNDKHKDSQHDLKRWIQFPDRQSIEEEITGPSRPSAGTPATSDEISEFLKQHHTFLNQNNYFRFLFERYIDQMTPHLARTRKNPSAQSANRRNALSASRRSLSDTLSSLTYIISGEELEHHKLIGVLLDAYAELKTDPELPGKRVIQIILKHLALFSYPIDVKILAICPDLEKLFRDNKAAKQNHDHEKTENIESLIEEACNWLYLRGLVFRIEDKYQTSNNRYALHRMVRDFLAYQMDYAIYDRDEHSFFDVTVFAEQPRDLPSPRYKDFESIQKILNALNKHTTRKLRYQENHDATEDADDDIPVFLQDDVSSPKQAKIKFLELISLVRTIRAGIHLMDTAFSIGVISRMDDFEFSDLYESDIKDATPYERYCDSASSLICNAVRVDSALKHLSAYNFNLSVETASKTDYRELRVFYPTQIAWLYNERAVTRFMQGRLFECLSLFDLAIKTLEQTNWSTSLHATIEELYNFPENSSLRRVLLNKAVAQIEFGQLDNAETTLKKLYRRCEVENQKMSCTGTLAGAYLGLVHHIRGSYKEARKYYINALTVLNAQHGRERSKALIYKFLGDLDRVENNLDDSLNHLELAANLADTVQQRDIYHQVMVSFAKLHIRQKNYPQAIEILKDTELYARKLGIPKLLVDCWLVRGLINLLEKQTTTAGEYLSHAIATSNRNGMVLYKVAALHLYCEVLDARNTPESQAFVRSIRKAAKTRSERIGYPFKLLLKNHPITSNA